MQHLEPRRRLARTIIGSLIGVLACGCNSPLRLEKQGIKVPTAGLQITDFSRGGNGGKEARAEIRCKVSPGCGSGTVHAEIDGDAAESITAIMNDQSGDDFDMTWMKNGSKWVGEGHLLLGQNFSVTRCRIFTQSTQTDKAGSVKVTLAYQWIRTNPNLLSQDLQDKETITDSFNFTILSAA